MEGEEGGGLRLSKRFMDKDASVSGSGEVDYKTKAGTAWSHSYLNQKPWHPLSYPNQRRKWIAEQTHAQRERRSEEVAREYAQEQEFFRQTALVSKKEKEKVEMMKAVSFMYVRPPGYNAESAKAAEIADEMKKEEQSNVSQDMPTHGSPNAIPQTDLVGQEKKKSRPKDVFGRPLPTEEEFEVLKNAPRLETGVPARSKPFGVEVRNVKCVRCGSYGHQSGDRECPLKDAIMPNEESRLKRDDPLTAILAHTDSSEPLKWELKQKPGISPPRGGFKPDDPNQQIVAEDIFDEYGGFLSGDVVPDLLTNFPSIPMKKSSKKNKHKKHRSSPSSRELKNRKEDEMLSSPSEDGWRKSKKKKKRKMRRHNYSSEDSDSDINHRNTKNRKKRSYSSDDCDIERHQSGDKKRSKHFYSSEDTDYDSSYGIKKRRHKGSISSDDSDPVARHRSKQSSQKHFHRFEESFPEKLDKKRHKHSRSRSPVSDSKGHHRSKHRYKHSRD